MVLKKLGRHGVLGFDTVKAVIVSILILAVIAIAMFLAVSTLKTSYYNVEADTSKTVTNESVTSTGWGATLAYNTYYGCSATSVVVINKTSGFLVAAANYTVDGCQLLTAAGSNGLYFNTSSVNVSYIASYQMNYVNDVAGNITNAPTNFFKQIPTFMTLLAVVVLILIIAIVIIAVTRFQGGEGIGGGGTGFGGGGRSAISEEL